MELEWDHNYISSFLDTIKRHTICSIPSLYMNACSNNDLLSRKLLNLFQNNNLKITFKTVELKISNLTNILCTAILECHGRNDVTMLAENCLELFISIDLFPCSTTLKFVHLAIMSRSPQSMCFVLDDFKEIEILGFGIKVKNEVI